MQRIFTALAVALAAMLLAVPALAGGWAVVTLDELPSGATVGVPLPVGFVVRQHGVRRIPGLKPEIVAVHMESGDEVRAPAREEGERGHYVAALTFPRTGTWRWSIHAFTMVQPMPPLRVGEEETAIAAKPVAVGRLARFRGWLAARLPWFTPPPAIQNEAVRPPAEIGRDLFLAKGCVVCHSHAALDAALGDFQGINMGPALTGYTGDPAFLRRWLKDPPAVRPTTEMPALGLSDDEIEALIAFLGDEGDAE